ncbi:MAG: protein-export chaperone SecB [Ignavibacteriales bacterium]|nr:protein-export chaperone SecB [Ignavibacteriales bacterium]
MVIKNDFYGKPFPALKHTLSVKQNLASENNRFVEVVLEIGVRDEAETLSLQLEIKGGFEGNKEMSDEAFKGMYLVNAPAILFPFARAIITTYTAQANIPPIVLPAVNFAPLADAIAAKE